MTKFLPIIKLAIGSVHRRIGPDRVEIVIKDAVWVLFFIRWKKWSEPSYQDNIKQFSYQEFTSGFKPEKGLIVVQDHGQTRIGDFIVAKLVDKDVSFSLFGLNISQVSPYSWFKIEIWRIAYGRINTWERFESKEMQFVRSLECVLDKIV